MESIMAVNLVFDRLGLDAQWCVKKRHVPVLLYGYW